jgi:hypothetical protein
MMQVIIHGSPTNATEARKIEVPGGLCEFAPTKLTVKYMVRLPMWFYAIAGIKAIKPYEDQVEYRFSHLVDGVPHYRMKEI